MKLPFDIIPQYIIIEYNLTDIEHNGKVYIKIWKGMYSLLRYVRISHTILKKHLEKTGYQTVKFNPRLCTQRSIPIYPTLIDDDFGINYVEKIHAEHLI